MNEILQAIFLGIIQGVTEVLPISSSGHLVLVPWIFDFHDPGLTFDVALHLGTLIAILSYFNKDIMQIAKGGIGLVTKKDPSDVHQKLFIYLGIATIPGVLAGVLLNDYAEDTFRSPLLIAGTLIFFAVLLYIVDHRSEKVKDKSSLEKMTLKDSLMIGVAQAIAIIPGTSRSGITMTAGLFRKLKREDAARFSFLLSVPIIVGASIFQLKDLTFLEMFSTVFITGFLAAAFSAFISVKFLMNYVKNHNFNIFVFYRLALAVIIIGVYFIKN